MMQTNHDSLKNLVKFTVAKLENERRIEVNPVKRHELCDSLAGKLKQAILTEEDLHRRSLEKLGEPMDSVAAADFTENERYKAARAVVRKTFGDDVLNGFFFQTPLKTVASGLASDLFKNPIVEEVYDSDQDLEHRIVELIKGFRPDHVR